METFFLYAPSYGVYISELISSALECSNVSDFVNKQKKQTILTAKLLKWVTYHKVRKAFSKFY